MKLWQLASIMCTNHGRERNLPIKVAASKEEWGYLNPLFTNIFECSNRDILDAILPEDFVRQVLEDSSLVCYKSSLGCNSVITSYSSGECESIPAIDVYVQYGGEVLERVFERGIAGDAGELNQISKCKLL